LLECREAEEFVKKEIVESTVKRRIRKHKISKAFSVHVRLVGYLRKRRVSKYIAWKIVVVNTCGIYAIIVLHSYAHIPPSPHKNLCADIQIYI